MRTCIVAALLFGGCGSIEVDDEFVKDRREHYFAFLEDGDLALGAKASDGASISLELKETNEEGGTPAVLCLDGEITVLIHKIEDDCMRESINVSDKGKFSASFEVTKLINVSVSGEFSDNREELDLWVQGIGSITMQRCNFVLVVREPVDTGETPEPYEELDPSCAHHF